MKLRPFGGSVALLFILLLPLSAVASRDHSRLVVFGDSISDPGNAFVLTGMALTPPYTLLIPNLPYARGGHHLSNGSTWIEQLAPRLKLANTVGPALRVPGRFSNYAIDRARACSFHSPPSYFDLSDQVQLFSTDFPSAPDDALYVLFIGANDVRDALATAPDLTQLFCALGAIRLNLEALVAAGARDFLVSNIPDLGLIPAVRLLGPAAQAGATAVSALFNSQLAAILDGVEDANAGRDPVTIYRIDAFTLVQQAPSEQPQLNVTDPCINPFDGSVCKPARNYMFWDGVHPTKYYHGVIADEAARVLGQ